MAKQEEGKPIAAVTALKKMEAGPLYFIHGEEPYFMDAFGARAEKEILPEAERDFNQVILYGKDVTMGRVIGEAKQFPFMGAHRLVIVREASQMDDLLRGDQGSNMLEAYAAAPSPTTTLIFCYKHKILDGRKSLGKTLAKHGFLYTSNPIKEDALPEAIKKMLDEAGVTADGKAVALLAQYVGTDLQRLRLEIDKVKLNVKPGQTATAELIAPLIGISREYDIFMLQKALSRKDLVKSLELAFYFAARPKEHPIIKELALLNVHFLRLLGYQGMRGKPDGEVAAALGMAPFHVRELSEAGRLYSLPQTIQAVHTLAEADRMAKGASDSKMDEADIWPWLVSTLVS